MIDCAGCAGRTHACPDCVVSALLGAPPEPAAADQERGAIRVLAQHDLLRLPRGTLQRRAG